MNFWSNGWAERGTGGRLVRFDSVIAMATGVNPTSSPQGNPMKARERVELLKDSIVLLRQVRSGMQSKSYRRLAKKIDEVIAQLELVVSEKTVDPGRMTEILKALGQGLATVPSILRIIEMIRNR